MRLVAQFIGEGLGDQVVPILLAIVVGTVLIVAIVIAWLMAKQRREAYERLARELGLRFSPKDTWNIPARYGHLALFKLGHSRKASNVLVGAIGGREVMAFDYEYTTGRGDDAQTYRSQVAILEMPILAPLLAVRTENLLDRVAAWVGHDDINFESEAFSNLTHVTCADRKFAYDIFHGRLIEFLLGCGKLPWMEFNGPLLELHDSRGGVEQARRLLGIGQEIVRSIPDYVLHERGINVAAGGNS